MRVSPICVYLFLHGAHNKNYNLWMRESFIISPLFCIYVLTKELLKIIVLCLPRCEMYKFVRLSISFCSGFSSCCFGVSVIKKDVYRAFNQSVLSWKWH